MSYKPNVHQHIPGTSGNQVGNLQSPSAAANLATLQSYRPLLSDYGPPSLGFSQGSSGSQVPQNKYAELLAIIEELGKEIRPTYAGSKSAMERLKRGIIHARGLLSDSPPPHGPINMSTDDSISEDVSSSGALSHCHASGDGDGGKESETSLVSSEGTSASGLAVSEDRHNTTTQTTGGTVENRPMDITPACQKIRSLCLSTDEAFEQGKSLPFINPSSLETLRALVQEIQSSGETDPEIWKDCEGRWLHLFQLVEKQYQEQILAQQEQYQCQIQLIQDEIKALVQLQNRQASIQPHTEFSPTPLTKTATNTKDYIFPLLSGDCTAPKNVSSDNNHLAAPAHTPFSSPSPPLLQRSDTTANQGEERATTVLSSGYGTGLSAWETCLEPAGSPGEDEDGSQGREKLPWTSNFPEDRETNVTGLCQQDFSTERTLGVEEADTLVYHQRTSGTSHLLTSWAQRQKLRPKKSKVGQASSQTSEYQEQPRRESHKLNPPESSDVQDQQRPAGPPSSSFPLRRSDSLVSEASGLTYWRLNENELYHPLPDSFDSGAYLLLQEASMSLTPSHEPRLSLREIYQNKQKSECKRSDWEGSVTSSPSSPQVLTLDPAANQRHSDRTSGFTSPSRFSSPSSAAQPHLYPRIGTPVTPDSMVECSPNPGDTDCISDTSSVSAAGPSPSKVQSVWRNASQAVRSTSHEKTQPCSHPLASEEEGSHTHTSTLKPCSASGAALRPAGGAHVEGASSVEDPVVLSLLRQNLREKHSRHVADLKAYYESEIQILRDKLKLRDLPQDLEKTNQALTKRCKHLDQALAEATDRIQELEAANSSLEKKLAEWPERYAVAGATVKSLQQRLEESKRSGKDKDALAARLKNHVRQLEESAQKACREADEKEARREREYKMLQDLLGEYDSLVKAHEALKVIDLSGKQLDVNGEQALRCQRSDIGPEEVNTHAHTHTHTHTLCDVTAVVWSFGSGLSLSDSITPSLAASGNFVKELQQRVISKLESQVKQLEHENQARARHASHSNTQPSGAGLFHHPDLLPSPSKRKAEPDVTRRKSPSDQLSSGRKSPFLQANQSSVHKKSQHPLHDASSGAGSSVDASSSAGGSWRCASPPECEQSLPPSRHQEQSAGQREAGRREASCALTPMMRALIELEETRATESRAPCKNSSSTHHRVGKQRTTVGFVERRHKEVIQERVGLQADREAAKPGEVVSRGGGRGGGATSGGETAASLLRAQRSLSPEGHRSSSLPPAHRSIPPTTPTKRETLLMPLSAKSSPKRCPTENYSTAFGRLMPREEHLKRFDEVDQRRHSFHSSSPRKRLQFTSDREDDLQQPESAGTVNPPEGSSQLGWDEQGGACTGSSLQDSYEDPAPLLLDRLHSLAEAEKLFDELTQEKLQIEAALSRMPGAGGRVSLQTRLDEVALENRLERVNRELGSIRMTLKRFHVLRSSANI
ncbi:M-phase phosphoprotein 9 [Collichthys lucidus]|uniref:M-phase phosphoprotein 9 n=1 Tax=Collichthys lucidus TaxID=240159 RepID=A0A4U5VDI3_COLLU|nr:M-phase phosphoprotein 9 [Collichthys lucidus]